MRNKSTIISFIISFVVVGSLIAVFTWNSGPRQVEAGKKEPDPSSQPAAGEQPKGPDVPQTGVVEVPKVPKQTYDIDSIQNSPTNLINAMVGLLKGNDLDMLEELANRNVMDRASITRIKRIAEGSQLEFDPNNPIVEVGTLDAGNKVRYRLNFTDGLTGVIDLKRGDDKLWTVDSITLPGTDGGTSGDPDQGDRSALVMQDAMGVTERFVNAVLGADFETAGSLVDSGMVSNATLAGLCILFEEGEYSLRTRNALKGSFVSGNNAGFLIYLNGKNGALANMGVTLKRSPEKGWLVSEVALDTLLSDYVKEVAGGEEVYVPLVKNPKGGDSLVLFFGFNEDTLTPRSVKQLEIVAKIVKLSDDKKLQISGHTDDVGGEKYNLSLSERRAASVKAALIAGGVPADRIVTEGFGKTQPRRTYGSSDSEVQRDEARRVNRRAEMYLDF